MRWRIGRNRRRASNPPIEQLGREIDWLEHHIDEYGTIVAKQPDVWGESRLTRHREEYEKAMYDMRGSFAVTYQASLSRSDQAYVGWAMALQSAASDSKPADADASKMLAGSTTTTASGTTTTSGDAGQFAQSGPFAHGWVEGLGGNV